MSKLINISDEVYEKLYYMKGSESFTFAIKRLMEKKNNKDAILSCAGKGSFNKDKLKDLKRGFEKWSERYA